jgi:hypothetical protein
LWGDHRQLTGYARGAWNYKLMMDASGYLAAEEWPELVDREGLNASQIREATAKRLFEGFHEISTRNFSEYGASIYLGVNLCAVRMLADFARDDEMRKRAAMVLDAMFLDIACTWNQGYNVGSRLAREILGFHRHRTGKHGLHRHLRLACLRRTAFDQQPRARRNPRGVDGRARQLPLPRVDRACRQPSLKPFLHTPTSPPWARRTSTA